jgi:hypothetical protein
VQVPSEAVLADADVRMILGAAPDGRIEGDELFKAAAVGKIEVQPDHRLQWSLWGGQVLVHEDDDQLGAIFQVGVEVPPFVRAGTVVGAGAVLPRLDVIPRQPKPFVIGIGTGGHGQRRSDCSHGMLLT